MTVCRRKLDENRCLICIPCCTPCLFWKCPLLAPVMSAPKGSKGALPHEGLSNWWKLTTDAPQDPEEQVRRAERISRKSAHLSEQTFLGNRSITDPVHHEKKEGLAVSQVVGNRTRTRTWRQTWKWYSVNQAAGVSDSSPPFLQGHVWIMLCHVQLGIVIREQLIGHCQGHQRHSALRYVSKSFQQPGAKAQLSPATAAQSFQEDLRCAQCCKVCCPFHNTVHAVPDFIAPWPFKKKKLKLAVFRRLWFAARNPSFLYHPAVLVCSPVCGKWCENLQLGHFDHHSCDW